jgi:transcriptional antiterminator RfaH
LLKENENPPISWPAGSQLKDFAGRWWVAHTKSRNEKKLANDLIAKNISYFLPMRWKINYIRGRKFRSLLPLFSGYLFFCGQEKDRLDVFKTNRVANILEVKDQSKFVNELSQIERAILAGVDLAPHKFIKAGQLCKVKAGPLAGAKGIIIQTKTGARLILQVDILGQAASVEIDTDIIEPLDQSQ